MREENRATNENVALMYKKMCEDNSLNSNQSMPASITSRYPPPTIGGDKSIF